METNRIIRGDAFDFLASLPDGAVDVVITDPPYDSKTHTGAWTADQIDFAALTLPDVSRFVLEFLRVTKRWIVVFTAFELLGAFQIAAGPAWIRAGIWDRVTNCPQFSGDRPAQGGEAIAIMHRAGRKRWNGGGKAAIWRVPSVPGGKRLHPTEKPIALLLSLVELFSDPGELVIDPFCGSGTTLNAAARLGRRWIGVEKNPDYVKVAEQRMAQGVLFA